jgi:hypothetical protein
MVGAIVRVGALQYDFNSDDGSSKITVSEQSVHPSWNGETLQNDYMLLRLEQDAPSSSVVAISNDVSDIAGETPLTVLGLGQTESGGPPGQLMDLETIAIDDAQCQGMWGLTYDQSSMLCAEVNSGGPGICFVRKELCCGCVKRPHIGR